MKITTRWDAFRLRARRPRAVRVHRVLTSASVPGPVSLRFHRLDADGATLSLRVSMSPDEAEALARELLGRVEWYRAEAATLADLRRNAA